MRGITVSMDSFVGGMDEQTVISDVHWQSISILKTAYLWLVPMLPSHPASFNQYIRSTAAQVPCDESIRQLWLHTCACIPHVEHYAVLQSNGCLRSQLRTAAQQNGVQAPTLPCC